MQDSNVPSKIVLPFGSSSPAQNITYPIPVPSQIGETNDAASYTDGFPPTTAQAGGYPRISDFQGLFYTITAWNRWQAAGGPVYYDSGFSASIGGYPSGAILSSVSTIGSYWVSTVDNNTSNPDTGGANWLGLAATGRLVNIQYFKTAGAFTYTPTTGATSAVCTIVGGGGGAGALPATGAGQYSTSGAAGAGGMTIKTFSSLGVWSGVIGAAGAGGTAGGSGGNGGSSYINSITALGGIGGPAGSVGTTSSAGVGAGAAASATGDLNLSGSAGGGSFYSGGISYYGAGGNGYMGINGSYGGGGNGQVQGPSSSAVTGFPGRAGLIIMAEYS